LLKLLLTPPRFFSDEGGNDVAADAVKSELILIK
jgi:hypothetical protein